MRDDKLKDWEEEIMEARLFEHGERGICEHCQREDILIDCCSRRADSDAMYKFCPYCAADHHEYWDEMWADYWSGRL